MEKKPVWRVAGSLMVTRAFGDLFLKKKEFSYRPFIHHVPVSNNNNNLHNISFQSRAYHNVTNPCAFWRCNAMPCHAMPCAATTVCTNELVYIISSHQ
eukprot:GEZU01013574.1.p1 GENE.GEZU01013574.1~~GEZU01013574.1.p1  ORF type:complete len:108 (+),score=18.39 GEZU01013574.1:33-326(+)